jgi:hypothetical protein
MGVSDKDLKKIMKLQEVDLEKCPACGGYADNGFDRCYPPSPYNCTKCEKPAEAATEGEG